MPHNAREPGKRIRGSLYVHRDAVHELGEAERNTVAQAEEISPLTSWNVVRLDASSVALLAYEDFDEEPFPGLLGSTLIDLEKRTSVYRDFRNSSNPLILHRKELLVEAGDARRTAWAALTSLLEAKGLFRASALIGRRRRWTEMLAEAGLDASGAPC